jgi:hypothetical protein
MRVAAIGLAILAALAACSGPGPSSAGPSSEASPSVASPGVPPHGPASASGTAPAVSASGPSIAPAPPPSSPRGADGDWRGTTSQHKQFELIVSGGKVASVTIGFASAACAVDSPIRVTYPHPIHAAGIGAFTLTDDATFPFSINGRLGPGANASGSATIDLSFCNDSAVYLTWSATR